VWAIFIIGPSEARVRKQRWRASKMGWSIFGQSCYEYSTKTTTF